MEKLIIIGADVNERDVKDETPLIIAILEGKYDVVEVLLKQGADINAIGGWWFRTPLHYASEAGYENIVELLISNGADVNAEGSDDATPLDLAVEQGYINIIDLLEEARRSPQYDER